MSRKKDIRLIVGQELFQWELRNQLPKSFESLTKIEQQEYYEEAQMLLIHRLGIPVAVLEKLQVGGLEKILDFAGKIARTMDQNSSCAYFIVHRAYKDNEMEWPQVQKILDAVVAQTEDRT